MRPNINNVTNFKIAEPRESSESNPDRPMLDKITVDSTIMISIEDRDNPEDIIVLQMELNRTFYATIKEGHYMHYGRTQMIKGEYIDHDIAFRECQYVKKEYQLYDYYGHLKKDSGDLNQAKNDDSDEDEDDFDDEDEEREGEESAAQDKFKVSNQGKLLCSFREKLNELIKDVKYFDDHFSLHDNQAGFWAQFNDWYPMPGKDTNKHLLCTGLDYKQPHFWFDGNRFVISMDLIKNQVDVDRHCDSELMMKEIDPRVLFTPNSTLSQKAQNLTNFWEDIIGTLYNHFFVMEHAPIFWRVDVGKIDHVKLNRGLIPRLIHYLSSYSYLKDRCRE